MSKLSREEAKEKLHAAGLRATAPRAAVLRLLNSAGKPLSHGEVVEAIGCEDWDQATLYRNLVKLVEARLAQVTSNVGGVARYEACGLDDDPHLHPHFSCRECGTVACLPDAKLAGPVGRGWSRSLENAELQLIGHCPNCLPPQRREKKKPVARKR